MQDDDIKEEKDHETAEKKGSSEDKDVVEDESEGDVEYVDEEMLNQMDLQKEYYEGEEEGDDWGTIKNSEIADGDQDLYEDGDINELYIENDSVCQL